MRTNNSMLDPRLVRQQQEVDLMRSMGMFNDQTQELSGLVNIINALQAPGMEQDRFERDFGLRELAQRQGQERFELGRGDQLGQQEWERGQAEKVFGLNQNADTRAAEGMAFERQRWEEAQQQNMMMQLLNLFGMGVGAAADEEDGRFGLEMPAFQRLGQALTPQMPGGFDIGSLLRMGPAQGQPGRPQSTMTGLPNDVLDRAKMMK
jgi:hypothetical protein